MFRSFPYIFVLSFSLILLGCGNTPTNKEGDSDLIEEVVNINGVDHFIKKIGKGDPLVVIHGGPGLFHNYLTPHFKELSQKYQIVFYDQRGCGKTEFPKDTSTISINNFVADLESIRNHLKIDKLNLVSHSWGTLIAVNYGKTYPQNLNKLILVSPAPATTDFFNETFNNMQKKRKEEDTKELVKLMMSKEFEKRDGETFKKAVSLGDKVNLSTPSRVTDLYEPMFFDKTTANHLLLVNSMMEQAFFDFDISTGLEVLTCPTLIIYGSLDNVPLASAQYIQNNIKNSKLSIIKNTCHYPFFESPVEFNAAVNDFLNSNN